MQRRPVAFHGGQVQHHLDSLDDVGDLTHPAGLRPPAEPLQHPFDEWLGERTVRQPLRIAPDHRGPGPPPGRYAPAAAPGSPCQRPRPRGRPAPPTATSPPA